METHDSRRVFLNVCGLPWKGWCDESNIA